MLSERGVKVDIYEKGSHLGGLASSSKLSKGSIDTFYHHLFETDTFILKFLKQGGSNKTLVAKILTKKVIFIEGILKKRNFLNYITAYTISNIVI